MTDPEHQLVDNVYALLAHHFANHLPDTITDKAIDSAIGKALDTVFGDSPNATGSQIAALVVLAAASDEGTDDEFVADWRSAMSTQFTLRGVGRLYVDSLTAREKEQVIRDTARSIARRHLDGIADDLRTVTR